MCQLAKRIIMHERKIYKNLMGFCQGENDCGSPLINSKFESKNPKLCIYNMMDQIWMIDWKIQNVAIKLVGCESLLYYFYFYIFVAVSYTHTHTCNGDSSSSSTREREIEFFSKYRFFFNVMLFRYFWFLLFLVLSLLKGLF